MKHYKKYLSGIGPYIFLFDLLKLLIKKTKTKKQHDHLQLKPLIDELNDKYIIVSCRYHECKQKTYKQGSYKFSIYSKIWYSRNYQKR